jgi:hypothetical protein
MGVSGGRHRFAGKANFQVATGQMGVSGDDTGLLGRDDWGIAEYSDPANRKTP